MIPEKTWYVSRDGKVFGPFTAVQMRGLIARSKIRVTDWVHREGDDDWTSASKINNLRAKPVPAEPTLPLTDSTHGAQSDLPNTGTVCDSPPTHRKSGERSQETPSAGAGGIGRNDLARTAARQSRFQKLRGFVTAFVVVSLVALAAVVLLQGLAPRGTPPGPVAQCPDFGEPANYQMKAKSSDSDRKTIEFR